MTLTCRIGAGRVDNYKHPFCSGRQCRAATVDDSVLAQYSEVNIHHIVNVSV